MPRLTEKQQIRRIKQIIRKDANTTGKLVDEDGKMCAIGGLAHYGAGISQRRLGKMDSNDAFDLVIERFPVLYQTTASEVYTVNDRCDDTRTRRVALCKFFDRIID